MNKPKIIVTLSPKTIPHIKEIDDDVYMYRLNLSHIPIKDLQELIHRTNKQTNKPVCIDTEGAQMRTGEMLGDSTWYYKGSVLDVTKSQESSNQLSINPFIPLKKGDILTSCRTSFMANNENTLTVLNNGNVKERKAVYTSRKLDLPAITKKDKNAAEIGGYLGVKKYMFSFAESSADVWEFRKLLFYEWEVISKIESQEGLDNYAAIEKASDGISIDRDDLSGNIGFPKAAYAVQKILGIARKPVFVSVDVSVINNSVANDITSLCEMGANGFLLTNTAARDPLQEVKNLKELL